MHELDDDSAAGGTAQRKDVGSRAGHARGENPRVRHPSLTWAMYHVSRAAEEREDRVHGARRRGDRAAERVVACGEVHTSQVVSSRLPGLHGRPTSSRHWSRRRGRRNAVAHRCVLPTVCCCRNEDARSAKKKENTASAPFPRRRAAGGRRDPGMPSSGRRVVWCTRTPHSIVRRRPEISQRVDGSRPSGWSNAGQDTAHETQDGWGAAVRSSWYPVDVAWVANGLIDGSSGWRLRAAVGRAGCCSSLGFSCSPVVSVGHVRPLGGGVVVAEGEHREGDEWFVAVEPERDPGEQSDLGVGGFDEALGQGPLSGAASTRGGG